MKMLIRSIAFAFKLFCHAAGIPTYCILLEGRLSDLHQGQSDDDPLARVLHLYSCLD